MSTKFASAIVLASLLCASAAAQCPSSTLLANNNVTVSGCAALGSRYDMSQGTTSLTVSDSQSSVKVSLYLSTAATKPVRVSFSGVTFGAGLALAGGTQPIAGSTFTVSGCTFKTVQPTGNFVAIDFPNSLILDASSTIQVNQNIFQAELDGANARAYTAVRVGSSFENGAAFVFDHNFVSVAIRGTASPPKTTGVTSVSVEGSNANDLEDITYANNVILIRGDVGFVPTTGLRYSKVRIPGPSANATKVTVFKNMFTNVATPVDISVRNGEALSVVVQDNQAAATSSPVSISVATPLANGHTVSRPIALTVQNNRLTSDIDAAQLKIGIPTVTAGSMLLIDANTFTTANPSRAAITVTDAFVFAPHTENAVTHGFITSNKVVSTVVLASGDAMFDFTASVRSSDAVKEYVSVCYNDYVGTAIDTAAAFKAASAKGNIQIPFSPIEECWFEPTEPALHAFVSAAADRCAVVGKAIVGVVASALVAMLV